jgi:deoxyribodipyrimidine photolyase-related protein
MTRTLAVVLGDQLDPGTPDILGLDPEHDTILMCEVKGESESPPSHVQRTVLFLSAMRHAATRWEDDGWDIRYVRITDPGNTHTFHGEITRAIQDLRPEQLRAIRPGSHRVLKLLQSMAGQHDIGFDLVEDPHFTCRLSDFNDWAEGRKELTMEYFYRERRKALGILVDDDNKPIGGAWNFDKENRNPLKDSPLIPDRPTFSNDEITLGVINDVREVLPDLPGSIDGFNWPVTPAQAQAALNWFIKHALPDFGTYQDAMRVGEHTLYHALLSPALNLKILDPMNVVNAAIRAYEDGAAPLNAVEGFVRQIIGWREFIRGVYWREGPSYRERNELEHSGALPGFYWDADTDMVCMRDAITSVLDRSYAHHISRLMVTGNFAMIAGIDPQEVDAWYLGMYADGVEWVTSPNTIGMALHADGGVVGTKPYAASGKYIKRMSNACASCRYDINARTGDNACPFNVFYWDFLDRHHERFKGNRRMSMILKNLERMDKDELVQIRVSARTLRERFGIES